MDIASRIGTPASGRQPRRARRRARPYAAMAALAAGLAGAGLSALGAPASAQQLTYTYAIGSQGAVTSDVGEFADMVRATLADGRCLLYTSPSPRDRQKSRMPSSA